MGQRKQGKVSIADVAKMANVSKMTVSRVINNSGYVAPATRDSVQKIIQKIGYHPSSVAQRLKGKIDKTIGIILTPRVIDETRDSFTYYSEMLRLILSRATRNGFHVIIAAADEKDQDKPNYIKIIEENTVFGFIILDLIDHDPRITELEKRGIPVVVIGSYLDISNGYCVMNDDLTGGETAAQHLIDIDRKKIAFIGTFIHHQSTALRLNGFRNALRKNGIPEYENLISLVESPNHELSGYRCMLELLNKGHQPDAVFCSSDLRAIGALRAIKESDLKVPEDIAVVGYDDLAVAKYTDPQLTTIHQPMAEMAEKAVTILKALYQSETVSQKLFQMTNHLIHREST